MMNRLLLFTGLITFLLSAIFITGCKDNGDDDPITGAIPTVSLSSSSGTGSVGVTINTTATLDAPEGLKKLIVYKNGASFKEVNYNFEKNAVYDFAYQVESGMTEGTVISFAFEAIDSLDRKSDQKIFTVTVTSPQQKEIVEVSSDITTNTTWSADKIWRINNIVKVSDGTTLTIEAGTIIFGASASKGTLVVMRGGKIIADGTSSAPIVFTSDKAPGTRAAGDWGGIIIAGKAPNNHGPSISLEGTTDIPFGGNVSNDNSGTLRYVRIEFAGKIIENNKEFNSLTLASVGSATIIENVQCSYGLDDSFEFFGGTVNAKRLVSYKTTDDDLDTDIGHNGFIQFALCIRDANIGDIFFSNGIETDNDPFGSTQPPLTKTVFANITIIGGKYSADNTVTGYLQNGAHLRKNSSPTIYNSFITGFPVGIFMDDTKPGVSTNAVNEDLQIRNTILAGVENWGNNNWGGNTNNTNAPLRSAGTPASGFQVNTWYYTGSFNNSILTKWQESGIDQSLFGSNNPLPQLTSGALLLTAGRWDNTPKASGAFFEKVGFIGAFGTDNWTAGWCNWDPQNTIYQ